MRDPSTCERKHVGTISSVQGHKEICKMTRHSYIAEINHKNSKNRHTDLKEAPILLEEHAFYLYLIKGFVRLLNHYATVNLYSCMKLYFWATYCKTELFCC